MSKDQRMPIFFFVKWLAERYMELEKKTLPYAFKLTGVNESNNKRLIKVQFAGTLHEQEIELEKLIDSNLFEYFHPQEKKILFSIFYDKERLNIVDQYFCATSNKEIFVLRNKITGNRTTISAEELSISKNLIAQLNPKEAKKIGYSAGTQYSKNILRLLEGRIKND